MDSTKKTAHTQIGKSNACAMPPPKEFEHRAIRVPANRRAPLKRDWAEIVAPITEHMKLQIQMNIFNGHIELRVFFVAISNPKDYSRER